MNPKFVWVVTYAYAYEGESVEGVYATKREAEKHPGTRYGHTLVTKWTIKGRKNPQTLCRSCNRRKSST